LGQRADATRGAGRHVEVDDDAAEPCAGVLVGWQRGAVGWLAHVAWVRDGQLVVGLVDAGRVRPVATPAGGPSERDGKVVRA